MGYLAIGIDCSADEVANVCDDSREEEVMLGDLYQVAGYVNYGVAGEDKSVDKVASAPKHDLRVAGEVPGDRSHLYERGYRAPVFRRGIASVISRHDRQQSVVGTRGGSHVLQQFVIRG